MKLHCASLLLFATVYVWLYSRLVSWRRPSWLLLPSMGRRSQSGKAAADALPASGPHES